VLSVLVHGLGAALVLARAASHVDAVPTPAPETMEIITGDEVHEAPGAQEARVAEVEPARGEPPGDEPRRGIEQAPIGRDAPDMLEAIQRQIASWDPRLVKGVHRSALSTRAGEDLPDPAAAVAAIDGVVRAQMRRFRICHGVGLPGSIGVGGEISVRLLIAAHGSVLDVRPAGGSFPDEAVKRCVVRAFTALQFPPPPGGATETVTYTVSLVAGDVVRAPGEALDPRRGEPPRREVFLVR
jgi:hypothetical protein